MADKQFADGIRAFKPNAKAPDFVKVELTINKAEFTAWLASQPDEVRLRLNSRRKARITRRLTPSRRSRRTHRKLRTRIYHSKTN